MDYDVLVVAGTGIDTIVKVDQLPVPLADAVGVPPIRDWVAHSGNGYALGFHSLGLSTKLIDFLGDDPQAALILAEYERRGLDFDYLTSPAGTPRAVNLVDATGRRMSFFDGRHPAELRLPREFYRPFLERAGHVHQSLGTVNLDLFEDITARGLSCSTDIHDWDGENPSFLTHALSSDLVFMSAARLGSEVPEVMRMILAKGRAHTVVATDGERGCLVLTAEAPDPRHFAAVRPDRDLTGLAAWEGWRAVDSNGAGDAFATAFTTARLAGKSVPEAALAGTISGAFACGSEGTHSEFITPQILTEAIHTLTHR